MPFIWILLTSLVGSAGARILTGAGLGLVSFASLSAITSSALSAVSSMMGGVSGSLAQIIAMSGIGFAMSAIGSGMIARVAIDATRVALARAA